MSRNLAASIRVRLKQHADTVKQDFDLTLTHYGLERLLYRLSISTEAPNFLLKGALLFSLWYDHRTGRHVTRTCWVSGPMTLTLPRSGPALP